jgi:hypothetical protein
VCISYFSRFLEFFSQYSRSYSVCISFSTFFSFLTIIRILQCTFLFFRFFSVSRHIPGPTVCFPYFP